jgi:hypothetical protein
MSSRFLLALALGFSIIACGGGGGGGETNPVRAWLSAYERNIESESLVRLGETIDDNFLNQPVGGGCVNKEGYLNDVANIFALYQTIDVQIKEVGEVSFSGSQARAYSRILIRGKENGSSVWDESTVDGYITLRQSGTTWLLYGSQACGGSPSNERMANPSATPLRIIGSK